MRLLINAIFPTPTVTPPEQRSSVLVGAVKRLKRSIASILGHALNVRRRDAIITQPIDRAVSPNQAVAGLNHTPR